MSSVKLLGFYRGIRCGGHNSFGYRANRICRDDDSANLPALAWIRARAAGSGLIFMGAVFLSCVMICWRAA